MDLAHLNFVHKGLTELDDGPLVKPHDVPEVPHGLEYAYEDGRLRREYTLYAPFTLHDKKLVIRADRGGTWSEVGETRAGHASVLSGPGNLGAAGLANSCRLAVGETEYNARS